MKRLIIADAHVGQRSGDVADMCDIVARAAADGYHELVYLGDGFQYLIGMSKFWASGLREVMAAWQEARRRGVRIVVIEGNRDFFLDEEEVASEIDWSGRRYEFTAGKRSFRLVHGDRVNRRDLQYRFWSGISKSWPARMWARLLPRRIAVAIVRNMEAKLATTNRKYRYRKPVADLRRTAMRAWNEGVDVMLWGHFHTLWECRDGDRLAMVVPAWLETAEALSVDDDGRMSWVEKNLTPIEAPSILA